MNPWLIHIDHLVMNESCVTWLIHMCDMTHSYVWHDSFICDMTHSYVTWLIHILIHTRAVAHSHRTCSLHVWTSYMYEVAYIYLYVCRSCTYISITQLRIYIFIHIDHFTCMKKLHVWRSCIYTSICMKKLHIYIYNTVAHKYFTHIDHFTCMKKFSNFFIHATSSYT